jgi:hypothetical protein
MSDLAYLSIANMRVVLSRLRSILADRAELLRLADTTFPAKQVVFDIMRDMSKDPVYAGSTLEQKNVATIAAARAVYERLHVDRAVASAPEQPNAGPGDPEEVGNMSRDEFERALADAAVAPPQGGDATATPVRVHLSLDGADREIAYRRTPADRLEVAYSPLRATFRVPFEPVVGVTSVRVDNVILPQRVPRDGVANNVDIFYLRSSFSHAWLSFDELPGTYARNKAPHVRAAFSKLGVKGTYAPPTGRGHLILEPVHDEERVFAAPIATLQALTVTLRRPDGALIDDGTDTFQLERVLLSNDGFGNWILQMSSFWTDDSFATGDVVRLLGAHTLRPQLDAFLNRPSGHTVLSPAFEHNGNVGPNYRGIVVRQPGALNPDDGVFEPDAQAVIERAELEAAQNAAAQPGVAAAPLCGVLNTSLQMSVSLTLVTTPVRL